jgi:GTP cyclohydrolase I
VNASAATAAKECFARFVRLIVLRPPGKKSMSATLADLPETDEFFVDKCVRMEGGSESICRTEQPVDLALIRSAVRQILRAVGEDPDREGLLETPRRVAKMYEEMFAGLHLDPGRHLDVTFAENYDEIVLVRDIEFTSMCEHHLLPFRGVAHVAYIPNGRVTGLSKLARVVEEVSRRPQVQERMTKTIADLIEERLGTSAVGVIVKAEHSCMAMRGVRKQGSMTVTSAMRGTFRKDPASRAELMSLIHSPG